MCIRVSDRNHKNEASDHLVECVVSYDPAGQGGYVFKSILTVFVYGILIYDLVEVFLMDSRSFTPVVSLDQKDPTFFRRMSAEAVR
jgi:hypothetical protein